MLIAPDRISWAAELSWLHPSVRFFQGFCALIAIFRGLVTLMAFAGVLVCWRIAGNRDLLLFFIVLIAGHMIGAGAAGAGRFVAPMAPYLDLFAAAALIAWTSELPRQKRRSEMTL
jgi:CHASE2 domain-containing sensor protein